MAASVGHWVKGTGGAPFVAPSGDFHRAQDGFETSRTDATPPGYQDITEDVSTGVWEVKAEAPKVGTRFVAKNPGSGWYLNPDDEGPRTYRVDRWIVTGHRRLKAGWTVTMDREGGARWQAERGKRFDQVAKEWHQDNARVYGRGPGG
ncbi:MAG: hypothetical protein GXY76_16415 [Chloroflexi bacterium]|mgnify:FL=1|nr:hypothetical protein [Chloroflexota bacterium]